MQTEQVKLIKADHIINYGGTTLRAYKVYMWQ